MKVPTKLIASITLLVCFLGALLSASVATEDKTDTSIGWNKDQAVPDIELPNLIGDGTVNLAELRGKVVYLDFWASWCKPCIESFPLLDEIYKKYKDQGFTVIAVNVDFNLDKGREFAEQHPVSYPMVYDNQKLIQKAKINAMPAAFYIDKKGIIRLIHNGFIPGDEVKIEKAVKYLLAE